MSLGILSRKPHAVKGLGAYTSVIPPECWGQAGFGDCHTKAYAQAQSECAAHGLKDDEGCIGAATDSISMSTCGCKRASATATKPKPKPVVVTGGGGAPADQSLAPPDQTILGLPMQTAALIAAGAAAIYVLTQKKGKKS